MPFQNTEIRWLENQKITLVEANPSHVEEYVSRWARIPAAGYLQGRLCHVATSIPLIAQLLGEQGLFSGPAAVSQADQWLGRFENYLAQVHGMSRYSRTNYLRYARRLLQSLPADDLDWTVLDGDWGKPGATNNFFVYIICFLSGARNLVYPSVIGPLRFSPAS